MHSNFNLLRDGACPLEQEKGIINSTYTESIKKSLKRENFIE